MFVVAAISNIVLQCALWGLLIAFGAWTYRHIKLRSLPWLAAYAFLSIPLSLFVQYSAQQIGHSQSAEFMVQWYAWHRLVRTLIDLALAVLVLSDFAFLLSKAGIELDWKPVQRLLHIRTRSTALGIALVCLMLITPLAALIFRTTS